MKIVIDISEKQYKWITDCEIIPEMLKEELVDAIRAGTPLQTGKWMHLSIHDWEFDCSECGFDSDEPYPYCPNCGAKMEERNEDSD